MNNEKDMKELHPLICEAIRDGGQFILTPKGVSMLPTIVPIKDCIVLITADNLRKNDIVLYKRKTGTYVAHRIKRIKDGQYTMCGDNQCNFEKGIDSQSIIAKVDEIRKSNGKVLRQKDIHSKRRLFSLFLKRLFLRTKQRIKKILYPIYKAFFKKDG